MAGIRPDTLERTLRRWRRATVVTHAADAAWLAVVCGGLTAILLHWLRADAVWPIVAVAGAAGVIGFRRVPRPGDIAAGLDRRFGLDDLLASAWAIRRATNDSTDDWRKTLTALADARAASIPAPPMLGRRSLRQHLCAAAALLALAMAVRLVPSPVATSAALAAGDAAGQNSETFVADVRQRAPDTADEATRVPAASPAETAVMNRSTTKPSGAGEAAGGEGRSNAGRESDVPTRSASTIARTAIATAGGSGTVATANGSGESAGRVSAGRNGAGRAEVGRQGSDLATNGSVLPTVVGESYRAIAKDFFDR